MASGAMPTGHAGAKTNAKLAFNPDHSARPNRVEWWAYDLSVFPNQRKCGPVPAQARCSARFVRLRCRTWKT